MGVLTTTLLADATVSATGGTAQNFTPDGVEIQNGIHLADAGEPDFKLRNQLTLKTRNPQLSNGVYGKGKRWATLNVPMVCADGKVVFNLVRIEVEVHPEMSASDYLDMLKRGSQLLFDSDTTAFWATGSLS